MQPPERDRVAIVVGGSRGLGRATVETLLRRGWRVLALARGAEDLDALASQSHALHGPGALRVAVADAADAQALTAALGGALSSSSAEPAWDRVAALVYVAGAGGPGRPGQGDPAVWQTAWATNVAGASAAVDALLPAMRRWGSARVVLVGSLAGREPGPTEVAYAASRWGTRGLARSLGEALAPEGIPVTHLALGAVHTATYQPPRDLAVGRQPPGAEAPVAQGQRPDPWCGVPAGEVADTIANLLSAGPNTWVEELVLRPTRDERLERRPGEPPPDLSAPPDEHLNVHWRDPDFSADLIAPAGSPAPPRADSFEDWHARLMAPAFYVNVGHDCDRDCPWCSVDRARLGGRYFSLPRVLQTVRVGGHFQLGKGLLIGGEPSLYPHLDEVLVEGRRAGVPSFGLITDGAGLRDRARVKHLAGLGVRMWQLSWDGRGPTPLTERFGHPVRPDEQAAVLGHLAAVGGGPVSLYHVVRADTVVDLDRQVDAMCDAADAAGRVDALVLALLKPVGHAPAHPEFHLRAAALGARGYADALRDAVARGEARGRRVWLHHAPGCLVPERPELHSALRSEGTFDPVTRRTAPSPSAADQTKGPACLRCRLFERCTGYFSGWVGPGEDNPFVPTGSLVRAKPLPAAALAPATPAPAASAGPTGAGTASEARGPTRALARARAALSAAAPAGWTLVRCLRDEQRLRTAWTRDGASVGLGQDEVRLSWALDDGHGQAFLRVAGLGVSYDAAELPRAARPLVRALARAASGELGRTLRRAIRRR